MKRPYHPDAERQTGDRRRARHGDRRAERRRLSSAASTHTVSVAGGGAFAPDARSRLLLVEPSTMRHGRAECPLGSYFGVTPRRLSLSPCIE